MRMTIGAFAFIENMSYFKCPDCGKIHHIFGESHLKEISEKYGIKDTAEIPIDEEITKKCDCGDIESCEGKWLDSIIDMIIEKVGQ